jgi:putative cardiolipin synthase
MLRMLDLDQYQMTWSEYALIYDPPDKGIKGQAAPDDFITRPILQSLAAGEREVLIVSPYFVPRKQFTAALINAVDRGIDVKVATNSLAANNQKTVHGGYAPYRKPLLRGGVQLFEVRPDARVAGTEYVPGDARRATLHTKGYVVDRQQVFIGSFNFDPRSANINTEMGVLISDPALAGELARRFELYVTQSAWALSLDEAGGIVWTGTGPDGAAEQYHSEPMTNWWQRFMAGIYRMLPIRSQL